MLVSFPRRACQLVYSRTVCRLMTGRVGEGDARSHNCPAGLVVDNQITNPNYTEFYLLSHSGLLGSTLVVLSHMFPP